MNLKDLHHWNVLALACIDGRFIERTIDWTVENAGPVFDFRTEVGSSKAIIDSEEDRERFFEVIATSKKLHDIKEVWLIDHIDCGAYGGSKEFESDLEERNFHIEKLDEAASIVKAQFPFLDIKKVYADWNKIDFV